MRHYIALYYVATAFTGLLVRLIKRNKSLFEMVQKVDLKTEKWQRQKELIKRFFWDISLCKAFFVIHKTVFSHSNWNS